MRHSLIHSCFADLVSIPLATVLSVVTVLSAAMVASADADWTGTETDQQISFDNNEYARGVQILYHDQTGRLYTVWSEDAPSVREILFGVSTDYGATWSSTSSDRIISLPDGKAAYEEPSIAVRPWDEDSPILVVWAEDFLDNREVHYGISTNGGATFSSEFADLVLSDVSTTGEAGIPSAAIDADGVMHVVWHQATEDGAEVFYSRSTDGGATWSGTAADRIISFPDGNPALEPRIMEAGNDRLIVIWREDDDSGGRALHLGVSDDGGDTWTSETADRSISQPVNLMTSHDAAAGTFEGGDNNSVYAVYAGSFDTASPFHYEVYVTYSTDNGATWTGETQTIPVSFDESHTRSASTPDVHFGLCTGAIVVWNEEDETSQTSEQHISMHRGGGWSGATADELVSFPDGEDGYRPSVTGVHPTGVEPPASGEPVPYEAWIAWTEFHGGATDNYEVHLSASQLCTSASVPESASNALWLRASPNPAQDVVSIEYAFGVIGPRPTLQYGSDPGLSNAGGSEAVSLDVFAVDGRRVRALHSMERSAETSGAIQWDLRGDDGARVSAGIYLIRISAGSKRHAVPVVIQ